MMYKHDEYVINLIFYDLLNVNYIDSCIKMFQDHKMVLESFKISRKVNKVQKGTHEAASRLLQVATQEQAAGHLVTSIHPFSSSFFSFFFTCSSFSKTVNNSFISIQFLLFLIHIYAKINHSN